MAGTTRQQKFSRLIHKEISDILQRDKRGILDNAFVTVTDVRVSPDLSIAKIYISMMLQANKEAILTRITSHKSEIRKSLGNRIRNQARIIPDLVFFIDEVEENAMRIESIIKNLNIPSAEE